MKQDDYLLVRDWRLAGVTWNEAARRMKMKRATLIKRYNRHGMPQKKMGRKPLRINWASVTWMRCQGWTWQQIGFATGFKPNSLQVAFRRLEIQKK